MRKRLKNRIMSLVDFQLGKRVTSGQYETNNHVMHVSVSIHHVKTNKIQEVNRSSRIGLQRSIMSNQIQSQEQVSYGVRELSKCLPLITICSQCSKSMILCIYYISVFLKANNPIRTVKVLEASYMIQEFLFPKFFFLKYISTKSPQKQA